jgi:hypothetical protein
MVEKTYRVTFERIGRRHDVDPLTVTVTAAPDDQADELAEAVYRYARRFLASRDVETQVDLDQKAVTIFAGFHLGGTGVLEVVENVKA